MEIKSPAFKPGESIPFRYTCDESEISPPLLWSKVPPDTRTFALILEDPDASSTTWVHWILFNIPGTLRELAENVPNSETLPDGSCQGLNDSKSIGYEGPCPPSEHTGIISGCMPSTLSLIYVPA